MKNKFEEKYNSILELQDSLFQDIINSDEPKYDKLSYIAQYHIWQSNNWIQHPFKELQKNAHEQLKLKFPDKYINFEERIHSWKERYSQVNIADYLECNYNEDENQKITVLKCSLGEEYNIKMTFTELVNHLYDWCIENKCIEYTLDW